jgi:Na+/H+-dicarboxylate symporter
MKKKKIPLYVKILIGMGLGLIWGLSAKSLGLVEFTQDWIKPWGDIFIRALKLIAIPLIIFSLIDGVSNLSDISKLSRIGGRTIAFYFTTTIVAISVGLVLVNIIRPGKLLSDERRESLRETYASQLDETVVSAHMNLVRRGRFSRSWILYPTTFSTPPQATATCCRLFSSLSFLG